MAKTLNRNLVGGLTLAGMVILAAAGFLLLANLPGRDPKSYEQEAKKQEDKKEWNQAAQTYARAYQRDPDHTPDYLIKAAKCAIEDGNVGAARELLTTARIKDPQLKSAAQLVTELEYELAKLFPSTLQWNRVLTESKKLVGINKDLAVGHQALGQSYLILQKEDASYRDKGEEELKKALELDPGNAEVVELLARDQWMKSFEKRERGTTEEANALEQAANALVSSALEKCPADKAKDRGKLRRLQVFYLLLKGDYDKAISELQAVVEQDNVSPDSYLMLGGIYSGASIGPARLDTAKAEESFKKALAIDPHDGRPYDAMSQLYKYRRENEKDPAKRQVLTDSEVALYKQALEAIPKTKHFRQVKDNVARVSFFRELVLMDLDRALAAREDAAKKKEALVSAESWINQAKQEVSADAMEIRFLNASLLNARGDMIAATKEAEAANRLTDADKNVRLQALLGQLYFTQNQWGAASKALKQALAIVPYSPMLKMRLGQVYLQMNEPTLVLMELQPSEIGPLRDFLDKNEFAVQLRMEAYRQLGQLDKANDEAKKLAKGTVGDELREIRLLMTEQKYNEAEAKLKPILAKNAANENAARMLFRVYEVTERIEEAKTLMKELLAKHPDNQTYRRFQLILLESSKNDADVLAFLNEEKDPFARALGLSDFYLRHDKLQEAKGALDEAEKLKPNSAEVIDRQLRLAAAFKDWDRMTKYVQKDAALNADGTEGKIAQGRMAFAQGKYQEAVDLITQGLARFGSQSIGWTYLAEAYLQMGNRTADAKNAISKALEIDPTNGYANRAMAQIFINEGDEKGAAKYVTAAHRALPDDKWLIRQTQAIKEKDNPSAGITAREKARREKPDDVENLVMLARLYSDAKVAKYDKAAEVYKEALKASKNNLQLAHEVARFFGREEVNRPAEGDALLSEMMNKESDKSRKAQVAVCLAQLYEGQKSLATADRYFRLAVSLEPTNDVLNAAGEFYARTNRYRDAVEYYNRLMKQATKPEDAALAQSTQARIIALWLALGDLDNAKNEIDSFIAKYPRDSQGMIFAGAYHRIGGDIQKAKEAFDAHLEKDGTNATALWQRGQMYMLMGKWQNAMEDLRKSKTFSPDGFLYQHRIALANTLMEMDRGNEAVVELRSILDQKPDQVDVAEALVDAYARLRPPRYSDAENVIYTYQRMYPKDAKWPLLLGRLGERMQKWDRALQGYEKAAELSRDDRTVLAYLFNAYKQAGKAKEMTDYLATKISEHQLERMPLQRASLGWAYNQIGMKDKALESYDAALAAAGEDFIAYTKVVGEMVSVLGLKESLARAESRAQADPQNIEKQKAVVHLLQIDGKPEEAIKYCEKVGKLAVRDQDAIFAHLAHGMLLEQAGRGEEAKSHYEAALKLDPKQPIALNNIAYLIAERLKNPSEALPYAQQAARIDTTSADVLDTLGYILYLNGRIGEALGALLRAKEIDRQNQAVLYHLGLAYQKKADAEEAKLWFLKAKEVAQQKGDKGLLPSILKALGEEK